MADVTPPLTGSVYAVVDWRSFLTDFPPGTRAPVDGAVEEMGAGGRQRSMIGSDVMRWLVFAWRRNAAQNRLMPPRGDGASRACLDSSAVPVRGPYRRAIARVSTRCRPDDKGKSVGRRLGRRTAAGASGKKDSSDGISA